MKKELVLEAESEARRFLKKVEELKDVAKTEAYEWAFGSGLKESSAVKRASLDLTRALAKIRK